MSARHRCHRCKNTFSKREQLEYHLTHKCSDEARAKRQRDSEELSIKLAAHELVLHQMARDRERRRLGNDGFTVMIIDLTSAFQRSVYDWLHEKPVGGTSEDVAALNPPDLLEARRDEDGNFSTE